MPDSDVTLAEALKEVGYAAAHIGTWLLTARDDNKRKTHPEGNGFDMHIAGDKSVDYVTDALTDKAVSFIDEERTQGGCYFSTSGTLPYTHADPAAEGQAGG